MAHNEFWAAIFEMCTVSILVNAFCVRFILYILGMLKGGRGGYVHPDFSPALTARPPRFLASRITRPSRYLKKNSLRILISSKSSLGERKLRDLTKSDIM